MEQEAPSSSGEVNLRQLTPPEAVPLSTDQEMIYMHQAIFKDSSYNMPTAFDCADTFSVQDICDALRRLVRRHYILHAMLVRDGKQVKLRPDPKRDLDIKISRASGSETEDLLFLTEFARTPFELTKELPVKALILQSQEKGHPHKVLLLIHHIVCDAVTLGILGSEFEVLLNGGTLAPVALCYGGLRDHQISQQEDHSRAASYWVGNLLPIPESLTLPTLCKFSELGDNQNIGKTISRALDPALCEEVRQYCREQGLLPFTFFKGLSELLVAGAAGSESFLLGVPVTGRMQPELNSVVGYLVNMLVFKVEVDQELTLSEHLYEQHLIWNESLPYQGFPIGELINKLGDKVDAQSRKGKHRLFDVMFNYLPNQLSGDMIGEQKGITALELPDDTAKFDLIMEVAEVGKGFEFSIQYRKHLFEDKLIEQLLDALSLLAQAACDETEEPLFELMSNIALPQGTDYVC